MSKHPIIIAIEGNIGAGKSTLLHQLKSTNPDLKIVFMQEPVDVWSTIKDADGETILEKYYKNPEKYSFPFQIMAYTTRLTAMRSIIQKNPDCDVIVCERSLEADNHIFAKMLHDNQNIEDINYSIYKMLYKETAKEYSIDGVVYLDSSPETCLKRIGKRARDGESNIQLDYLASVDRYYREWLLSDSETDRCNILHIDTNIDVEYKNGDDGCVWIQNIMDFVKNIAQK